MLRLLTVEKFIMKNITIINLISLIILVLAEGLLPFYEESG